MDFRGDERGQPVVIGALLVFVILVLAFSGYQAVVVPQQNADVEFQHSQDVQDDMVDLRIAVVKTAIGDSNTSTGVQLGTRYPSRLIALNPAPPTGTLRTTEPGDIGVNPGQGNRDIDPCPGPDTTRAFVYSPDYNEFHAGAPLVYENTVAYSLHRNGEPREVLKTSQQLVDTDSGIIRIVSLQGEYYESGTQRVNVDLIRGETISQDVQDPVITLPTQSMNQTTWDEILEGDYTITDFEPGESITFEYGETLEVRCTQVGVNREPGSTTDGGDGTGDSGGDTQSDRVEVTNAEVTESDNSTIRFTLNNTGSTGVTIEAIAIDSSAANVDSVYRDPGNELEQATGDGRLNARITVGEPPTELDEFADIADSDDDDFILGQFVNQAGPNNNPQDLFGEETTITLVFSDGSSGQYTLNP